MWFTTGAANLHKSFQILSPRPINEIQELFKKDFR